MISVYILAFTSIHLGLVPLILIHRYWCRVYKDFKKQHIFLLSVIIISLLSPILYLKPDLIPQAVISQKVTGDAVIRQSPVSDTAADAGAGRLTGEGTKSLETSASPVEEFTAGTRPFIVPLLSVLYLCGIIRFLLTSVRHSISVRRLRAGGEISVRTVNGRNYNVLRSPDIHAPFSAGVFRPVIYLGNTAGASDEEAVLQHESCHIDCNHIAAIWIAEFYASLLWFLPTARYLKRQNSRLIELITDASLSDKIDAADYAESLYRFAVRASSGKTPVLTASAVSSGNLSERIELLLERPVSFTSKLTGGGLTAGVLIFTASLLLINSFIHVEPLSADSETAVHEEIAMPVEAVSLMWPLPQGEGRVTLGYGKAGPIKGFKNEEWFHNAIDIAALPGTSILAAAEGRVLETGRDQDGYGRFIILQHSNGLTTLYTHLQSIAVEKGQAVEAGSEIGLLGNSGRSTGPHLHFAVSRSPVRYSSEHGFIDADYADPAEFLNNPQLDPE